MSVSITNPSLHHKVIAITKSGDTNFTIPWDASVYDTLFFIKKRNATGTLDWYQIDGLRGYNKYLSSNSTNIEVTDSTVLSISGSTCTLKSTLSDGDYDIQIWKAGLVANRQTNTAGSITSTVSANTVSGFSIVSYSGTGVSGTIGHGLGAVPKMIIVKNRVAATNWPIYHVSLGQGSKVLLDTTAGSSADTVVWNNTAPTSTVFSVGSTGLVGNNGQAVIAYVFAEVSGFSKFNSYSGTGNANGPFVYCGYSSGWVLIKRTDTSTYNWTIWDTTINISNPASSYLNINLPAIESSSGSDIDILSNGIKLRNANNSLNAASSTQIYATFAQHSLGGSNVAPTTAR